MNGWAWAGVAVAVQIVCATLMSWLLRHGKRQPRPHQNRPHAASWGRTDLPAPDTRPTPAHSRLRPQHRRHR